MNRRPIIVGNWKMQTTLADAMVLSESIKHGLEGLEEGTRGDMGGDERGGRIDVVICPPFTWLYPVHEELRRGGPAFLHLGAQNVFTQEEGAYTGEVSIKMLENLVKYVIVGHSERRYKIEPGESDEVINKKLKLILSHGLQPILCLGERVKHVKRSRGRPRLVHGTDIVEQLEHALVGVDPSQVKQVIIAYEPVWAIGTGDAASGQYASEQVARLRLSLAQWYGREVAQSTRIIYGGSTNSENAREFLREDEIDGLLPGGASLKASEFIVMCKMAAEKNR